MNTEQRAIKDMAAALAHAEQLLPDDTVVMNGAAVGRWLLERKQDHDHALEQALTRLQKRYAELEAKVGAQPDIGDELTIAYMDGMFQGKQMAKRDWVELTPEQVRACFFAGEPPASSPPYWWEYRNPDYMAIYNNIEAKLREKNGGNHG